jgi:deoxyribonuclease-4
MMRFGYHVMVGKGLVRAARHAQEIGCECMQMFARNARGWRARQYPEEEVAAFREVLAERDIAPLVIHANYLANLASPNRELRERSRRAVADDQQRAARLGARFVVVHTGHPIHGGPAAGLRRLAASVRSLLRETPEGVELLLENSAGGEGHLGGTWEQFAQLLDALDGDRRLGLCFDTCHAHAAGYRLDRPRWVGRTLRSFAGTLGLDRLRLIHLNDSMLPAGSGRDRHEHIGQGTIGDAGFRALLRRRELQDRCAILETPIRHADDDERNLAHVRELVGRERQQRQPQIHTD